MQNEENFDTIVPHSVGDDVSKIGQHQFSVAFNLAAASEKGILHQ